MSIDIPSITAERSDFIRDVVADDLRSGRHASIVTRFPPEPNGHLHIGHAKSICLNFGIAQEFGGRCHLRFDDTNPTKEEQEYIDAIQARRALAGLRLGRAPLPRLGLLRAALRVGRPPHQARAWPTSTTSRRSRSASTAARSRSPARQPLARTAPVEENLDLFERMRAGEFPDGSRVLRARIDMASPNLNLRDPVLYRILHATHPRTGDAWCIYPTYDFAHGQSDAIEGVTHSICTLEFENHRPLYDWFIEHLPVPSRAAPVRVRAPQPDLDGALQALPAAPRGGRPRARLGRPAHAHHRRLPAARLPGRGHPRLRHRGRRQQARRGRRDRAARARRARRAQSARPATLRRPAAAQGRHRGLPGGPGRAHGGRQQPGGRRRPGCAACPSRGSSGSSATTSWRIRPPSSSAWRRAARCACATPTSSPAARSSRTPPARSSSCAARTTRPRGAGTPRMAAAPRPRSTGSAPRTPSPAEVRLYERLFVRPDPGADGDLLADLDPASEEVLTDCWLEPAAADLAVGRDGPVRATRLLLRRPRFGARSPGLQPHAHAQGQLGQGPGAGQDDRLTGRTRPPGLRSSSAAGASPMTSIQPKIEVGM